MAESKTNFPMACSLTPAEISAMREGLLPGLLSRAVSGEAIVDGFRWQFRSAPGLLRDIGAVIEAEHRCCPFLRFVLEVEPGDGPIVLNVTGPEGAAEFLSLLLEMTP